MTLTQHHPALGHLSSASPPCASCRPHPRLASPHPYAHLTSPPPTTTRTQVLANWRGKLERVDAGEQRWGLFRAFKPAAGRDFHAPEPAGDGVAALA